MFMYTQHGNSQLTEYVDNSFRNRTAYSLLYTFTYFIKNILKYFYSVLLLKFFGVLIYK